MRQIALNTDLTRPAANVMTRDAAVEYEMKLLNQAIEQSLHDQVDVEHLTLIVFVITFVLYSCV